MEKRKYICKVESDNTFTRTYEVETTSAKKAAAVYGRAEGGEEVTISTKTGKILSKVIWSDADRDYIRVTV